jgi:Domain of unknown function (DU1801)
VKKKNSGHSSDQVEIEAPSRTRSVAARRSVETQLRSLVAKFAPSHVRLVSAVRRSLRRRLPTAHELVYEYRDFVVISFSPNDHGYEGVFALRASADGVKFYFNRGKELSDPAKLLRGAGNQTRWILLEKASELERPEVVSLLEEALAQNLLQFDLGGSGSIVFRSKSTKQS